MMIGLGRALLADICEHPDDDAVRLVYADWLDDHDQPERAELLRLEVRRRRLDDLDPEAWAIEWRQEQVSARHREAWSEELPVCEGAYWEALESGLAERLHVQSLEALLAHEDVLFSAAPIRSLQVLIAEEAPVPAIGERLARCRYLKRLRKLVLIGTPIPERLGLEVLASNSDLEGLHTLDLSGNDYEDDLLDYLRDGPAWPALE